MPRPVHNHDDPVTLAREEAGRLAKLPIDERKGSGGDDWSPRAGQMHPVDKSFYDLTVKELNLERVRCDRLRVELREARDSVVATLQSLAPHEITCTCPEGGVFDWRRHADDCPRQQVGAMLDGALGR